MRRLSGTDVYGDYPVKKVVVKKTLVRQLVRFPQRPAEDEVLTYVPFAKDYAGCSTSFTEILLFTRKEHSNIVNFLKGTDICCRVVQGPPGCGKSTAVWTYLLGWAKSGKKFLWFNMKKSTLTMIDAGEVFPPTEVLLAELDTYVMSGVHTLVLDGLRNADIPTVEPMLKRAIRMNIDVILVASTQVSTKINVRSAGIKRGVKDKVRKLVVKGWTMKEYEAACEHDLFFNHVLGNLLPEGAERKDTYTPEERRELLRQKFYYAGHSARWMFDFTIAEVVKDIKDRLAECNDFSAMLDRNCTLMLADPTFESPLEPTQLTFISPLVARMLARYLDATAVKKLYDLTGVFGTPTIKGSALEIDFISSVRRGSLKDRVFNVVEPTTPEAERRLDDIPDNTYVTGPMIIFYKSGLKCDHPYAHTEGVWFVPESPYQGGFGLAQLRRLDDGALCLRAVNVTLNKDHDLKMQDVVTFLNSLNALRAARKPALPPIRRIELVMMLPKELALQARRPEAWVVEGEPSDRETRSQASAADPLPALTILRRVAGFIPNK